MTNLLSLVLVFFLAQLPDLPSPTPWASPTPPADVDLIVDDGTNILATAQADEINYRAEDDQVFFDNRALLPDIQGEDSRLLFSYSRWLFSNAGREVFGPFAPLLFSMSLLITLGFVSLLVYFWENVVVTSLKIVGFIVNSILRIFGR